MEGQKYNYFAPANPGGNFTSDNRRAEHAYSDRDSRFRGGFNDRRSRDRDYGGQFRGGSRGRDRRGSGRDRNDWNRVYSALLPPSDAVLYHDADAKDPSQIDYSFYDMPVSTKYPRNLQEITPYKEFTEFIDQMPQFLQQNIKRMKYQKLTPIQQYAIPIGQADRDILATSQTGSGKSASFLIPCFLNIVNRGYKQLSHSPNSYQSRQKSIAQPFVIVMSPTRELALQNAMSSWQLSNNSGILTRVCYGGEPGRAQAQILSEGCDIIIATPGRLKDFLNQGLIDCRYVKHFVLDEADTMLDFGFFDDIKEIRKQIIEHRQSLTDEQKDAIGRLQTSLFSATFPKEIRDIAREFLQDYCHIQIGEIGVTGKNITQVLLKAQGNNKYDILKYLAGKPGQMLVFCQTKAGVDQTVQLLRQAFYNNDINIVNDDIRIQVDQMFEFLRQQTTTGVSTGAETTFESTNLSNNITQNITGNIINESNTIASLNAAEIAGIHGDLSQAERTANLARFRAQRLKILVATDVAQRGLDLPKVDYVINFDMPSSIDDYCHRIGRTGRAGRRGCSISLVTDKESKGIMKALRDKLIECEQLLPAWFDQMLREKWTQDAPQRRRGRGNSFYQRGNDRRYGGERRDKFHEGRGDRRYGDRGY